ncbi:hypothetical protein Hanom_Chr02g00138211 [Helianthus anomalus]
MEGDAMLSRLIFSSCNFFALLAEGKDEGLHGSHEEGYRWFCKKKEESWVKKVGELTCRHEIEVGDLKKRMEADKLQLKADREALDVQKNAFAEEKEGLKASVVQATGDNQWLIEHGFEQVVTYLLHSTVFNSALGDVYTKLLNYGKHLGLVVGFNLVKIGGLQ